MEDKRPNRHSNPNKYALKKKRNGRFRLFIKKKNREVRELLREVA